MEKNLPRKQNATIKTTTNKIENVIDNEHSIFLFSETKQDDLARKEMGYSCRFLSLYDAMLYNALLDMLIVPTMDSNYANKDQ